MTTTVGNEAELQAHLESQIRAALPLLPAQIRLERHLHLRLGHQAITIDGVATEKEGARGRFDILVVVDGKPLVIAELKATDVTIELEDVAQALSYARLHEPPVPLILVTNGKTTTIRRTYDGAELQPDDVAAERLDAILSAAAAVAAAETEEAVRTLLGASPITWTQMVSSWSDEAIEAITGGLRDLRRPIARGLSFPREAAREAAKRLRGGARLVVVDGSPLSGVTHVLVQVAKNPDVAPCLYVDGSATSDVLQSIANRLSRELSFGISKDDVRGWLNTTGSLAGITLVIDGLPRNDFDELIGLAEAGVMRMVLGLNAETLRRLSTVSGRNQQSPMGRIATVIDLEPLSDDEFHAALQVIEETCDACFFNGAQHEPRLRWPRTLRLIAGARPKRSGAAPLDGRITRVMLPPIPGPPSLAACHHAFASEPSLKFDLRALARAYLIDVEQHAEDQGWMLATWGRPSVDAGLLERELGEARVERLRTYGFLSWVDTKELGPCLMIRVEELLGHDVADEWAVVLGRLGDRSAIVAQIDRLLRLSDAVPGGEVALAAALTRASKGNERLLGTAVRMLLERKPKTSRLKEGARVDVLLKDGRIRLHFGEGMDEEAIGGLQPWLVLSHLASWPMAVEDAHDETANFDIFATLGVWPHLLFKPPVTELTRILGIHVHDVAGVGSVPCLSTGIVEPLLQAMLGHAHSHPNEMVQLAQVAMERKEAHLAWRVLTVALTAASSTDPVVEKASRDAVAVLREWWAEALQAAVHGD